MIRYNAPGGLLPGDARFPLIDARLTLADCHALMRERGIELPMMYRLGYRNNNCIGCVKGGAGYWNKIRRDFPEVFQRMAAVEKDIGATILRRRGVPLSLLDLIGAPFKGGEMRRSIWLDYEFGPLALALLCSVGVGLIVGAAWLAWSGR